MTAHDRFLGRAGVYAAARPGYPAALGAWLAGQGLLSGPVADLGAGTGLFTRLLLEHGAQVTAIEPNAEMRSALETALAPQTAAGQLRVQAGTSEDTGLPDASVRLVTAAQAAHWFAPAPTQREFGRILDPQGRVLLVWNDWRGVDVPFNRAYGQVVARFSAADTPEIATRVPEAELPLFMPGGYVQEVFANPLTLSRERLHGLAGSVSYLPSPSDPQYPAMTAALDEAFAAHQTGGSVELAYRTYAYLGRVR